MRPTQKSVSMFATARFQTIASPQQSKELTASRRPGHRDLVERHGHGRPCAAPPGRDPAVDAQHGARSSAIRPRARAAGCLVDGAAEVKISRERRSRAGTDCPCRLDVGACGPQRSAALAAHDAAAAVARVPRARREPGPIDALQALLQQELGWALDPPPNTGRPSTSSFPRTGPTDARRFLPDRSPAPLPARARRRHRDRADLRRRLLAALTPRQGADLASLPGRPRRAATSTTTSAIAHGARHARAWLEGALRHAAGPAGATSLDEVRRYTKLFWINSGPFNNLTARKFVLRARRPRTARGRCRRARQERRCRVPRRRDARGAAWRACAPMFFDPQVDPIVTNKTPGPGTRHPRRRAPTTSTSASRMADLAGLPRTPRPQLAAREARRTARRGGLPRRRPLRRADPAHRRPPSPRRVAVRRADDRRGAAGAHPLLHAPAKRRTASPTTSPGSTTARRPSTRSTASSRSTWTRAASRARGKASSATSTRDKTRRIEALASNAQWFEDHMPWSRASASPRCRA